MKVGIRQTGKEGKRTWLIVDVLGVVDSVPEDVVFVVAAEELGVGLLGTAAGLGSECEDDKPI